MVPKSRYNDYPHNCKCVSTTVTCNNNIPDTVPNSTVEVLLVDLDESALTPRRFCNITWLNVVKLGLFFYRSWATLHDNLFECLDQMTMIRISGYWSFYGTQIFGRLDFRGRAGAIEQFYQLR